MLQFNNFSTFKITFTLVNSPTLSQKTWKQPALNVNQTSDQNPDLMSNFNDTTTIKLVFRNTVGYIVSNSRKNRYYWGIILFYIFGIGLRLTYYPRIEVRRVPTRALYYFKHLLKGSNLC